MRRFTFFILCSATLLATSCNQSPGNQSAEDLNAGEEQATTAAAANAAGEEYFRVQALPVAPAKISSLSGKFKMLNASAANGIPSNGRGGGCLVFDPADLGLTELAGRTCTANSGCQNGGASAAYCDMDTKKCWARPAADPLGNATCNRPITMSPSALNPAPATPLTTAAALGVKPGAKVRVVACLNKLGANPATTGCGSIDGPDRIEVMGPVATVKP